MRSVKMLLVADLINADNTWTGVPPARRAELGGAAGPAGLDDGEPGGGERRPPGADAEPRPAHPRVRQEAADPAGPDGAVGRAHHRLLAVPVLPRPHLQRHQHRPGVRGAAPAGMPRRGPRRRLQPGALRRADPARLRQRLLPQPSRPTRPAALGSGALQRRLPGCAGAPVRLQPGALRRRLRGRHDQDGQHRPPHRVQRPDQAQLQGRQQLADWSSK
uniref:Uncharacterized protein n=1 Tax=Aegilops tauschii subsp. strangulata TaxID=200361 RepID=A0A453SZS1_AEGTS